MLARALKELKAPQSVLSVAAARRVASVLADVEPDTLAQALLEQAALPARDVLGEATCTALREGRYGSPARAHALMCSLARRGRSAGSTGLRSPELLARLAVCALVGAAHSSNADAHDADAHDACTGDGNWLAALARRDDGRFWRCFAGACGRGALAVRAAPLLGEGAVGQAARAVAALAVGHVRRVGCDEGAVAETARVLLEAGAVLRGQERVLVDAELALLCRCVETDSLSAAHDVVAALRAAVANGDATAGQQHELTVLCAFLLATTGGALGEDLVPALEQTVRGVSCTFVRALVQGSLITFLYTAEGNTITKKLAEKLLNTLETQSGQVGAKTCSCQSQPGQNNTKLAEDAPLGLTLMSFAKHFCTVTHNKDQKYSEWLRSLSKRLGTLNSCRPMLLFFLSPLLLPQYSHEALDQTIPLFQTLAAKHPEESFALFPHVLNLLVSDTLSQKSLSHFSLISSQTHWWNI